MGVADAYLGKMVKVIRLSSSGLLGSLFFFFFSSPRPLQRLNIDGSVICRPCECGGGGGGGGVTGSGGRVTGGADGGDGRS